MDYRNQDLKKPNFKKISDYIWEIGTDYKQGMRVPARIYASQALLDGMDMHVFDQITNVATLPGIVDHAYCMPDGHSGYGFPIGGVAAMDIADNGVISPGGIGFDINCGMRLVRTDLTYGDVKPKLRELLEALFKAVPSGVGSKGFVKLDAAGFRKVVEEGSAWCIDKGYGWPEDLAATELGGREENADNHTVSNKAIDRGKDQIGTLGSGNHYLEIQHVKEENIIDKALAKKWGIFPDQIVIMFHCGSRGFGHQIGTDYLRIFDQAMPRYGIRVNDRELACAPFRSPEGQAYFGAMTAAANSAFANRQVITHRVREVFSRIFGRDARTLGLDMIYDVCHNTAKLERHRVDGREMELVVHRKGATRAFGPGAPDVPSAYRTIGQPVIIGGSMETGSALLVGTAHAMEETWGSTAHGAGRTMSRAQAKKRVGGDTLIRDMAARGIVVRAASKSGVAEEAGFAYKDLSAVVDVLHRLDLSRRVATLSPIGNIKG